MCDTITAHASQFQLRAMAQRLSPEHQKTLGGSPSLLDLESQGLLTALLTATNPQSPLPTSIEPVKSTHFTHTYVHTRTFISMYTHIHSYTYTQHTFRTSAPFSQSRPGTWCSLSGLLSFSPNCLNIDRVEPEPWEVR